MTYIISPWNTVAMLARVCTLECANSNESRISIGVLSSSVSYLRDRQERHRCIID